MTDVEFTIDPEGIVSDEPEEADLSADPDADAVPPDDETDITFKNDEVPVP